LFHFDSTPGLLRDVFISVKFPFHLLVREPYKFSKKTANLNPVPARIIESFLLFPWIHLRHVIVSAKILDPKPSPINI